MSQQSFDEFWAKVQKRYALSDANHGPPNQITVQARARYEAMLRRQHGVSGASDADRVANAHRGSDSSSKGDLVRARHRVLVGNGVAT